MSQASTVFVALLLAASLSAPAASPSASRTLYTAPPGSQGCPVVFSAERLSTPGLSQAGSDSQQKLLPQMQQMMALHQQLVELELKRSEASSKLAQLPVGADPATVLQLTNEVKALDAELVAKRGELKQVNEAISTARRVPRATASGQGVQISFSKSPSAIVGVDLTVHGASMSARMTPAVQTSRASDLTQTFHLSGSAAAPLLESALTTQQPMIVTWVELTRLDYSDGSTWQPSSASRCAASPSLFVLVGSGN